MASEGLHEPAELLSAETIDLHRGYTSVIEELEAIDWYNQRVEASDDAELARVLTHSRDEEKEHAMMTLEWLRRHDAPLELQMRKYLFTNQPLPRPEAGGAEGADAGGDGGPAGSGGSGSGPRTGGSGGDGTLGIGSLRGETRPWGGI